MRADAGTTTRSYFSFAPRASGGAFTDRTEISPGTTDVTWPAVAAHGAGFDVAYLARNGALPRTDAWVLCGIDAGP